MVDDVLGARTAHLSEGTERRQTHSTTAFGFGLVMGREVTARNSDQHLMLRHGRLHHHLAVRHESSTMHEQVKGLLTCSKSWCKKFSINIEKYDGISTVKSVQHRLGAHKHRNGRIKRRRRFHFLHTATCRSLELVAQSGDSDANRPHLLRTARKTNDGTPRATARTLERVTLGLSHRCPTGFTSRNRSTGITGHSACPTFHVQHTYDPFLVVAQQRNEVRGHQR